LDLGSLWRARDYQLAGEYFEQALSLARSAGDKSLRARSLSLVGNRYLNDDRPLDAQACFRDARIVFEQLQDRHGLALSVDFLAGARYFAGDLFGADDLFQQAAELYHELDQRQGVVSCEVMLGARGINYLHEALVWPVADPAAASQQLERALLLAREINWRPGEAFALAYLALTLGACWDYARALSCGRTALETASAIEHG
jgi:tetratricopeptide (TPR) repeat protein